MLIPGSGGFWCAAAVDNDAAHQGRRASPALAGVGHGL